MNPGLAFPHLDELWLALAEELNGAEEALLAGQHERFLDCMLSAQSQLAKIQSLFAPASLSKRSGGLALVLKIRYQCCFLAAVLKRRSRYWNVLKNLIAGADVTYRPHGV
jgi:hypothetical protein